MGPKVDCSLSPYMNADFEESDLRDYDSEFLGFLGATMESVTPTTATPFSVDIQAYTVGTQCSDAVLGLDAVQSGRTPPTSSTQRFCRRSCAL